MKQPANILVLTDGFAAPAFNPRVRVLCNTLSDIGYKIDVFAEQIDPITFQHNFSITPIPIYKHNKLLRKIDWIFKNILSLLFDWKNRYFARRVYQLCKQRQYDLVFCSSFHTFPLRAANQIAHKMNIPCILDLRDITEQAPHNRQQYLAHHSTLLLPFIHIFETINLRRRNTQLRQAQALTTVSPWHQQQLLQYNNNTHLIYNGYDQQLFFPQHTPTNTFQIIYTGKIMGQPMQDPTLFFNAMNELINEQPQFAKHCQIIWYIPTAAQPLVQQWTNNAKLTEITTIHNPVPLNHIPTLLNNASIILVLSNTASDTSVHGMMTTKFFEALGVEKPVLCVRSDQECLEHIIYHTNAGLAANNKQEIKNFILQQYNLWRKNGYTQQPVINKQLFSRQQQANQFETLFLSLK